MRILLFIIIFAIGVWIGRKSKGSFAPKTPSELAELREESFEVLSRRTEKRKEKILDLAKKKGRITNDEVEDMFCISDRTASRYLNELEAEGKIKQIGRSGRGVHYTPISTSADSVRV